MKRSPLLEIANEALDGELAERLTDWRGQGLTFDAIARELQAKHGITVTAETVRNWCVRHGIHEARAAS